MRPGGIVRLGGIVQVEFSTQVELSDIIIWSTLTLTLTLTLTILFWENNICADNTILLPLSFKWFFVTCSKMVAEATIGANLLWNTNALKNTLIMVFCGARIRSFSPSPQHQCWLMVRVEHGDHYYPQHWWRGRGFVPWHAVNVQLSAKFGRISRNWDSCFINIVGDCSYEWLLLSPFNFVYGHALLTLRPAFADLETAS